MNCFINQLLYFGLMANFTVVPNTTSTCSSKDLCVSNMCELAHQPHVDIVCFMPSADYIQTTDVIIPILCSIILFLVLYSIMMTFVAWYHWHNRY